MAQSWSRRLAAAQTIAVVEAGGRTVSLGSLLGPEFADRPHHLFGPDRFHPSEVGYKRLVQALLPTVLVALGITPDDTEHLSSERGDRLLSLSDAAVEAARVPGTEVESADVGSRTSRPLGAIRDGGVAPTRNPRGPRPSPTDEPRRPRRLDQTSDRDAGAPDQTQRGRPVRTGRPRRSVWDVGGQSPRRIARMRSISM